MSAVLNYRRKRLRDDFIRSGEIRKAQMKQLEKENEGRKQQAMLADESSDGCYQWQFA